MLKQPRRHASPEDLRYGAAAKRLLKIAEWQTPPDAQLRLIEVFFNEPPLAMEFEPWAWMTRCLVAIRSVTMALKRAEYPLDAINHAR